MPLAEEKLQDNGLGSPWWEAGWSHKDVFVVNCYSCFSTVRHSMVKEQNTA